MTPAQLATLKTELTTDPRSYGYAAFIPTSLGGSASSANWNGLAAVVNLRRDGNNGGPAIIIKRNDVTVQEVLAAIDTRDFKASPTTLEASWLESITQGNGVLQLFNEDDTNTLIFGNLKRLLLDTQLSQTRLTTLAKRNGSRAEELGFGKGVSVTDGDVEAAVRLP